MMRIRGALTIVGVLIGLACAPSNAAASLQTPSAVARASSNSAIVVSWNDSNLVVTGFKVERSLKATTGFKLVATMPGNVRSFNDSTLLASTTYYYRVRAVDGSLLSRRSAVVNATTFPAAAPTLAAPTATRTATPVVTATPQPTLTATQTAQPTVTATLTAVATRTATPVPTATQTAVPTATQTAVATRTATPVPTATQTAVPTATQTAVATRTATPVPTATQTAVPTATQTAVPTATQTAAPTATQTAVPTRTATPVPTATGTLTATPVPTATPSAQFDPVLVGFLPGVGSAQDVTVAGATAFVASNPYGLSSVDVSVPSAPKVDGTPLESFPGQHSALGGGRAVVTGVAGGVAHLWVLDVTGAQPTVLADLPTTAAAILDVAISGSGTVAATAMGTTGIWVFDLANPAAPVKRGVFDTAGVAMAVALNSTGSLAYVADGVGGLKVISLANPAVPVQVGSLAITGGIQRDIVLDGNLAYLVDQTGRLIVVDVTTASAPRQIGMLSLGEYAFQVAVDGGLAVVHYGNNTSNLGTVDVSNPTNPVLLGTVAVDAAGGILGVGIAGHRAYVANGMQGLKIYDLVDPRVPTFTGVARDGFTGSHIAANSSIAVVTGVQQATNTAAIVVVDTSDPTNPAVAGTIPTTVGSILDVSMNDGGTVAVAALGSTGIWVLDVSNPAAPRRRGSYDTSGIAMAACLNASGSLAYVADGVGGLKIVSLANLDAPTLVGSLAISGGIQRDVVVRGGIAYLLDQTGRLITVDVTNPSVPVQLGALGLGQYAFNLAVDGTRAVVHYGNAAANIGVIDVGAPASPVLLSTTAVDAVGAILGVAVSGNKAYVADGAQGMKIYDISNPTAPTLLGGGYSFGKAMDVVTDGAMVQIADSTTTVSLIDLWANP